MNKFLEKFFKNLRMREWRNAHHEQWAQFSEWAGQTPDSSKLNSDQRKWLEFLERRGSGSDAPFVREPDEENGFLKIKDLPTSADLSDEQAWEDLYQLCQNAWYQMKHGSEYASYPLEVREFIDSNAKFFDDVDQEVKEAADVTKAAIKSMLDLLDEISSNRSALAAVGTSYNELQDLKRDCNATPPKYNTNKTVRDKIIEIARNVISPKDDATKKDLTKAAQQLLRLPSTDEEALSKYINQTGADLRSILDENDGWNKRANDTSKFNSFKNEFAEFLQPIYANKDIFEAFKSKEPAPNSITKAVEKTKTDLDYDNKESKNYIRPKREEALTPIEQIQKWAGEKYEDYLKKYEGLRGGKKVAHPDQVGAIIRAIDKAKVKPTDGLPKLIENIDTIQKSVGFSDPRAAAAFKWFGDALKDFNADPKMATTIKGALKNGHKLKNLISELAWRAHEEGKPDVVEYAEIAMNVLRVINYGHTTSNIMNEIKSNKELFSFLSNEKLSWNKNDGIKFITNAMDKTFRAACLGIGYGVTFGVNKLRQRGKRFHGHRNSPKMEQAYKDWYNKNDADKADAKAAYDADRGIGARSTYLNNKEDAEREQSNVVSNLTGMTRHDGSAYTGTPDEILSQTEEDIRKYKTDRWYQDSLVNEYEDLINSLEYAKGIYENDIAQLIQDEQEILADTSLSPEQLTAKLGEIARQETEIKKELKKIGNKGEIDLSLVGITPPINLLDTRKITSDYLDGKITQITEDDGYKDAQKDLTNTQNAIYERQSQIDTYRKAAQDIKSAQEQMDARGKRFTDWDKNHRDIYKYLLQYWDTLQDSSLTSYRLGAKRTEDGTDKIAKLLPKYSAWDRVA